LPKMVRVSESLVIRGSETSFALLLDTGLRRAKYTRADLKCRVQRRADFLGFILPNLPPIRIALSETGIVLGFDGRHHRSTPTKAPHRVVGLAPRSHRA
jgi:hypothetical protein